MQEKVLAVLALAACVVGFSFVSNFWQQQQVKDSFREILNPLNAHTFKDREGLEEALYQATVSVVGEDAKPEVELFHYQGAANRADVDMDALPKYGGVDVVGEKVQMSALVGRVWWYQYTLWNKDWKKDVQVTKTVFVAPEKVGPFYESPAKADFDFVEQPWLLLDASK